MYVYLDISSVTLTLFSGANTTPEWGKKNIQGSFPKDFVKIMNF